MRPIKLKIKGLNSFIEEQTVDFEQLTDRGLFGIFGPTGSGKSTVLDGITLALYGKVARESTNYINSNCDSSSVSFEFQVSGAQCKKYLVAREFKTDKASGNPRSGKCKVLDITNGDESVIADSVSDVTNVCREIIGLTFEDFTRTVVLPQGKFSEFLKLKGLDRNKMLERLFNLQQYGDELVRKLSREINKEKKEQDYLIGKLSEYAYISEEVKNEKENELTNATAKLEQCEIEFKNIEKYYLENQEIWKLQLELKAYKEVENNLKQSEASIMLDKEKIKFAESAEKVYPYMISYEKIIEDIKLSEEQLEKLKVNLEISKINKEKAEEEYIIARGKKDNELQTLKLKEQKAKDASDESIIVKKLDLEILAIRSSIETSSTYRNHNELLIKDLDIKTENLLLQIKDSEERFESLKVDSTLKVKVQEGMILNGKLQDLSSIVHGIKLKKENIELEIDKSFENAKILESNLVLKDNELKHAEELLVEVILNCPGEQNDLLVLQKQLSINAEKWNRYNEYLKVIEEEKNNNEDFKNKIEINSNAKYNLEVIIEGLKKDFKELQIENLAHQLRGSLECGEGCPVCGSIDHKLDNIKQVEIKDSALIENEILAKEKELKFIEVKVTKAETNISVSNKKIVEAEIAITKLGSDFKAISLDKLEDSFNNLQLSLKEYEFKKKGLENQIISLKDENNKLNENINIQKTLTKQNNKQLLDLEKDISKNIITLEDFNSRLGLLSNDTGIRDFNIKNKEILLMEKESEILVKDIKDYRKELDENNNTTKKIENELTKIREKIATETITIEEKLKYRHEKIESIKSKVGEVLDIEKFLLSITNSIKLIEDDFINSERLKET
ncbi:MAG: AAA family ATPase, partial [Clostridium sp.]